MFRTLLIGLFAALALSTALVGTAQAVPPTPTPTPITCSVARANLTAATAALAANPTDAGGVLAAAVAAANVALATCTNGNTEAECEARPGWSWDDSPAPGRCVRDNDRPRYNDCNEYSRHRLEIRRGDDRYNESWDRNRNGVMCDQPDVIIINNNGDCTTYINESRDYGTRYNSLARERYNNARRPSSDGGTNITDAERRAINNANDLRNYRDRYNASSHQLRTVCNQPPPVVITENPSPVTITTQAPPPPGNPVPYGSSGGQVSKTPSGGAETGDGSVSVS